MNKSSWWLIEVPFLDLMTQGRTRKEALMMIQNAIMELLKDSYADLLPKILKSLCLFMKME
jgi:predicted RNase H-like HicB family nuclease